MKKALNKPINADSVAVLTASAETYLSANYVAPPKPVAKDPDDLGIRYSLRETEVRFRLKDDYSPSVLDSALRGPLKRRDISQIRRSLNDRLVISSKVARLCICTILQP